MVELIVVGIMWGLIVAAGCYGTIFIISELYDIYKGFKDEKETD